VHRYAGEVRSSTVDGKLMLVNVVDLESYVASVMASEISPSWHTQALRAQAIAVRTYALRRMRHKRPAAYDVVDDTSNQVYHGVDGIVPAFADAAKATASQALVFEGGPADVWYHSACGGHTAASSEITGVSSPAYLLGVTDADARAHAFCALSPSYTWRNTLSARSLARVVDLGDTTLTSLRIADRWDDGRVRTIRALGASGATRDVDGHAFYARAGAVLGYKVVPSALFDVATSAIDAYVISGRGVGHGVGMCQWGAQGRARAGYDAASILAAYFPGTSLSPM
jgi:stage II sporulation protein D